MGLIRMMMMIMCFSFLFEWSHVVYASSGITIFI